jgi:hypothetical protein
VVADGAEGRATAVHLVVAYEGDPAVVTGEGCHAVVAAGQVRAVVEGDRGRGVVERAVGEALRQVQAHGAVAQVGDGSQTAERGRPEGARGGGDEALERASEHGSSRDGGGSREDGTALDGHRWLLGWSVAGPDPP